MRLEEKNKKVVRVYFIVPAPLGISPGQRFRFEHYLNSLEENGIKYKVSSFYTIKGWGRLYKPGHFVGKVLSVGLGLIRRIRDLFLIWPYNFVYVYREAMPIGPPVFEWIISKLFKKKIIYDFDDAIWIPVSSEQNKITSHFKCFWKVGRICKWSYKVSVGNGFLLNFVSQFNKNGLIIPTVVDTNNVHNEVQKHNNGDLVIGWTGTFSTLKYLEMVLIALQKLQERIDFSFLVIANKDPKLNLSKYQFVQWNKETEIEDLMKMHIGIMPLQNNDLEKGKCGFKAIQYLSLGIPAVVSPVGVNKDVVEDGVNGFIANNEQEWISALERLLNNKKLRIEFGEAGRKKIVDEYSVHSSFPLFLTLFT